MGGGELALDADADVTDAVSNVVSLNGVPGGFTDAILACLDLSLSSVDTGGADCAGVEAREGGTSVLGVGTTRKVLGAVVRFIGDPVLAVTAVAGLAGTDVAEAPGVRLLFTWPSLCCEIGAGDCSTAGGWVAALISSFPGGCRFVDTGVEGAADVFPLGSPLTSLLVFLFGLVSAFFLLPLVLVNSFVTVSAPGCFPSSFRGCFFCTDWTFLVCSAGCTAVGVLITADGPGVRIGVPGGALAATAAIGVSTGCFDFLVVAGVVGRIGVTGMTGTTGVMFDEVVRDIGREPGRDCESSFNARGMAGTVKPGGIVGVDRRGCERKWPLSGVAGILRAASSSGSVSFTKASTLKDACWSALKVVSSTRCQLDCIFMLCDDGGWVNAEQQQPWQCRTGANDIRRL